MEKLFEKYCRNYGFVEDVELKEFKNIISKRIFKEIQIDVTKEDKIILLRTKVKKPIVTLKDDCVIIYYDDKCNTQASKILLNDVQKCIIKQYNSNIFEIMLMIHKTIYKLFIIL